MPMRRREWMVPTALMLLSAVPVAAGIARLVQIGQPALHTAENARFLAAPVPVVLHVLSVVPYALLGAWQFAPSLRGRSRFHRAAGRLLVPLGFVAALSGLWMTLWYPWPQGDGLGVYIERLLFGTAMLASLVLALVAVKHRDFHAHGAWMTRAYAIGLGAGTQVLTHLPWFLLVDRHPTELARAVMMGAGWIINLVVAERVIRNHRPSLSPDGLCPTRMRSPATTATTAPVSP